MAKKVALLLFWLLVWALTIKSSVYKNAKVKAEESKAAENMQDAHEKAKSWLHWAQFKLSMYFQSSFPYNVYEETKHRLKMVMNLALDKASGAYHIARRIPSPESDSVSKKAGDAKSSVSNGDGHTTDQAAEAYGEALHNVKDRYKSAKETMNDEDKARYEAAKEKASDSAGILGNEMRDRMAEL